MLNVCVLGSGSTGNCVYVGSASTHMLIDAGLSGRETERRMVDLSLSLDIVTAICLTHEHDDHVASLGILARRLRIPVYANAGTIEAVERAGKIPGITWNVFTTGYRFEIGDLTLEPFSVPHDCLDPVGFLINQGNSRVAVVTDMGTATTLVRQRLRGCHLLVLESNHDSRLLKESERPWSLKQRIAGRHGHFSNEQACELVAEVAGPELQAVYLAHLSQECNDPVRAMKGMQAMLIERGLANVAVEMTHPDKASRMWTLS